MPEITLEKEKEIEKITTKLLKILTRYWNLNAILFCAALVVLSKKETWAPLVEALEENSSSLSLG